MLVGGATDVGGRKENQDAWGAFERGVDHVVVVCDGAGGHRGGAAASQLAVRAFEASFEGELGLAVVAANEAVIARQEADLALADMRTTLIAMQVRGGRARWAHVGDSRCYHLRAGAVMARTRDDSVTEVLLAQGELQHEDQFRDHPDRSRILRALGSGPVEPTVSEWVQVLPGDRFILCSDGVWEAFDRADLEELSRGIDDPQDLAGALVARGAQADDADNCTAVVVDIAPVVSDKRPPWAALGVGGLVVALACGGAALGMLRGEPGPLVVGPDGPYTRLQDAVAAAEPGSIIELQGVPGQAWSESVVLDKPVTLRGVGEARLISSEGPCLEIASEGVRLEDLDLGSVLVQAGAEVQAVRVQLDALQIQGVVEVQDVHLDGGSLAVDQGGRLSGDALTLVGTSFVCQAGFIDLRGLEARDATVGLSASSCEVDLVGALLTGHRDEGLLLDAGLARLARVSVWNSGRGVVCRNVAVSVDGLDVVRNEGAGLVLQGGTGRITHLVVLSNAVGIEKECTQISLDDEAVASTRNTQALQEAGCP